MRRVPFKRLIFLTGPILIGLIAGCPEPGPNGPGAKPVKIAASKLDPFKGVQPAKPLSIPEKDLSFRFKEPERIQIKRETPLSLTASDGTGLQLLSLQANGVIEEPLAFTELRMVFENPRDRVIEGRFKITLPTGASISRFAMKINDRWQEGEVVERQAARRAYEDFLHRRQDPALLEQGAANEFTARVFPIPARGKKELILSYSQELESSDTPYRIPLVGLPQLGELKIRVLVAKLETKKAASSLGGVTVSHEAVEVEKRGWVPDKDFEVAQQHSAGRFGLRHENLVVARVVPVVNSQPEAVSSLMILVDTSASRALGFTKQIKLLKTLIEGLARGSGGEVPIVVAAYDQEVEEIYSGAASGFSAKAMTALRQRSAMGASNLSGALAWAKAKQEKQRYGRVLLLTDGVATAGLTEGDKLIAAASALKEAGVERIDAVAVGGIRATDVLKQLVTAGSGRHGVVADGDAPIEVIGRKLSQKTTSGVKVSVDGARWVWPSVLDGFQAGDQVLVFADVPKDKPFKLSLNGMMVQGENLELAPVERPLIERAWVKARISRLMHQRDTQAANDADMRAALKKQVTDISVKHRVLSPYTALLVLETEADYRRFNIDRNALADILTVGTSGLTVVNRSASSTPATPTKQVADENMRFKGSKEDAKLKKPKKKRKASLNRGGDVIGGLLGDGAPAAEAPAAAAAGPGRSGGNSGGMEPEADEEARMDRAEVSAAPSDSAAETSAPVSRSVARPEPSRRERRVSRTPPREPRRRPSPPAPPRPPKVKKAPYDGNFAKVMAEIKKGDLEKAHRDARAWREESPGDVMALIAMGEVFEVKGDLSRAARAYGSLIDLFPSRADMRRFAGERLERLAYKAAGELAVDTFDKAAKQRPDHPASHRLFAFALVKQQRFEEAFEAMVTGLKQSYPSGRFRGVRAILGEDLGLVAAAWSRAEPKRKDEIMGRLQRAGGTVEQGPSLRFVLNWETDANDVDFHIYDGKGGHAYYRSKNLPSGGRLYADVTTGYGPECFTIRNPTKKRAYPYKLQAHYYRRGPMGYGMGKLQIIEHDGKGGLTFEERPFVVMVDGAYVDLGTVK